MKPPAPAGPQWDPWTTFDISKEKLDVALKRKELYEQRKLDFQRMIQNPKNHTGKGGALFDPALQRWYSAKMTSARTYQYGRNSPWSLVTLYFLPIGLLIAGMRYDRNLRETAISNGEVKTSAKMFKMHFV